MSDKNKAPEKTINTATKILGIVMIFTVIAFDQLSKWVVTELVMKNTKEQSLGFIEWLSTMPTKPDYMSYEILPFYNIVMVWNYGVSFGMFNNKSQENALILVGIAAIIAFILILWMLRANHKYVAIALGLAIGGAFGNIIDRIRFGAVADFIDIHAFGYHWPAFNVADSAIVVGIGYVIIHSLFFEKKTS